LSAQSLTITS